MTSVALIRAAADCPALSRISRADLNVIKDVIAWSHPSQLRGTTTSQSGSPRDWFSDVFAYGEESAVRLAADSKSRQRTFIPAITNRIQPIRFRFW